MNQSENDGSQLYKKPSISEVDRLAKELIAEYGNPEYFKWYCAAINQLGVQRVNELRGMVSDAKQPGRLFSKRAKEEMRKKVADEIQRNWYGQNKSGSSS